MSASTNTVQGATGIRRIGAAIVVSTLALTVAAVVAFGSLTASNPQDAQAPAAAPATWDHGTSLGGSTATDASKGLNGTNGRRFDR